MEKEEQFLHQLLTVIITTSPVKSNPSTEMIDAVRESFKLIEGLWKCPQIVVADGYRLVDKSSEKSGKVTPELAERYKAFLSNLERQLEEEKRVYGVERKLFKKETRCGFAENLKFSLTAAKTPFVMVVQHDQAFFRPLNGVSIMDVLYTMINHEEIKYIGLMSRSDQNYDKRHYSLQDYQLFREDYSMFIRDFVRHTGSRNWQEMVSTYGEDYSKYLLYTRMKYGLPLMPLDFWYDKPHVVKRDVYLDFVFGQTHFNYQTGTSVEVTNFVEDSLGNVMKSNIKRHGMCAFNLYGCYSLYDEPDVPLVGHLDGRHFLTIEKKRQLHSS